jgi:hypothetical protein
MRIWFGRLHGGQLLLLIAPMYLAAYLGTRLADSYLFQAKVAGREIAANPGSALNIFSTVEERTDARIGYALLAVALLLLLITLPMIWWWLSARRRTDLRS